MHDSSATNEPLPLELLDTVRIAQCEHGLKHSEFRAYRIYCTRKLHRLYKCTGMTHKTGPKGKFRRRPIVASDVHDVRVLQVPLLAAERAWAYAMDIKNEMEQSNAPYKRRHMVKRLSRAHVHAKELASLVAARSLDTRSTVEADAYLHWIAGSMYLEKGNNWEVALEKLSHAHCVLEELSKVSNYNQLVSIRYLLDRIEPAIRFCEYELTRSGVQFTTPRGGDAMDAATASKFRELSKQVGGTGDRADGADEVRWNGESYPVTEGRCKNKVQVAAGLVADLEVQAANGGDNDNVDELIQMHDRVVNAYADARGAVRSALQLSSITNHQQAQLTALGRAIHGVELEWTIKRNAALAKIMEDRLQGLLMRKLPGSAFNRAKDGKDKLARPEGLVRTYENLAANVTTLSDLAAESGGTQGERLMDICSAKLEHFRAYRCYFIAHKYLSSAKYAEAHGLFGRCLKRCTAAAKLVEESTEMDLDTKSEISALADKANAFAAVCIAEYRAAQLEQSQTAADAIDKVSLADQPPSSAEHMMVNSLGSWKSFADASSVRISGIPPALPYIPARPIVLDGAIVGIEPPVLAHRVIEEPSSNTSVVSRIFGWS